MGEMLSYHLRQGCLNRAKMLHDKGIQPADDLAYSHALTRLATSERYDKFETIEEDSIDLDYSDEEEAQSDFPYTLNFVKAQSSLHEEMYQLGVRYDGELHGYHYNPENFAGILEWFVAAGGNINYMILLANGC